VTLSPGTSLRPSLAKHARASKWNRGEQESAGIPDLDLWLAHQRPVLGPLHRCHGAIPNASLIVHGVLSRNSTDVWRESNKLQAPSGGLFGEPLELLLLVFGFIEFNSSIYVVMAKLQHPVGQASEHANGCARIRKCVWKSMR